MFVSQSAPYNPGVVSGVLRALLWLLFLQCAAVSAASSAHLLGLSDPAHDLQVHVHGQGEKITNDEKQGKDNVCNNLGTRKCLNVVVFSL